MTDMESAQTGDAEALSRRRVRRLCWSTLVGTLVVVAILAIMVLHTFHEGTRREQALLQTIVDFRAHQIGVWLDEHDAHAELPRSMPLFTAAYRRWREQRNPSDRDFLLGQLLEYGRHTGFSDAILWDLAQGRAWSASGGEPVLDDVLRRAADQVLETGAMVRHGPYPRPMGGAFLDFILPSPDPEDRTLLIMRLDPVEPMSLYLMIWPLPELPGDIFLLRRAGDLALAIGAEVGRHPGRQVSSVPMDRRDHICVQALLDVEGHHGLLEGLDGGGVPSVGVAAPIPGTDWLVMAKVDRDDFRADLMRQAPWVLLAGLLTLTVLIFSVLFMRQREKLIASQRERQVQAEKLRALELVDAIAGSSDEGIFAKDLDGRYLLCNPVICELLGTRPEKMKGENYRDLYPPEMVERLEEIDRRILREDRVFTGEEVYEVVASRRVFLTTRGPLHDASGRIVATFGVARDITERKRAEEALRESEERYRLLFESASDALLVIDPEDGQIMRANPAAVTMFRARDEADFVSRSFWDYSPAEQEGRSSSRDAAGAFIAMALRSGAHVFDWQHRRLDGEEFPATVCVTRFELFGQTMIQSSIRDITSKKRQQEELVSSRTKLRELTAHRERVREDERAYIAREIHDDLGQYLTALRMEANLMDMLVGEEGDALKQHLSSMKGLIDHLIAETRRVIARLRPVALDLGLVSAAEWLAADYQERMGICCHLDVSGADELDLDDDQATTLFRILQECLTNVTRHARASRVDIRLSASDGVLCMEVKDDGRGFDPIEVRDKKTFGLMGIRERVLIYGGGARIDAQPGRGTRLIINLPIKPRGNA